MQSPFLVEVAVAAADGTSVSALRLALHTLEADSFSVDVAWDSEAAQAILRGADEGNLAAAIHHLRSEVGSPLSVGAPQAAYRETLAKRVEVDFTHKKQSGGSGEFARIMLTLEPGAPGQGMAFVDAVKLGNVPPHHIPAIEAALREGAQAGAWLGFPLIDFTATLTDGAYHDVDSSAGAFATAARGALYEGVRKAGITLLEPIVKLAVLARRHAVAAIQAELAQRRARIEGQESGETCMIVALVPMAALFGFRDTLAKLGHGEASVALLFDHYAEVPSDLYPPDDSFPAAAALTA